MQFAHCYKNNFVNMIATGFMMFRGTSIQSCRLGPYFYVSLVGKKERKPLIMQG